MSSTVRTNQYAQTASYFVFQSCSLVIASFISIAILTIHWIEYQTHQYKDYDYDTSIVPTNIIKSTAKKPKRRRRGHSYRTLEEILIRLEWWTIFIFCVFCISYSLLTIIEQVARLNEIAQILCNKWTMRIMASAFQFAVGTMHCLFMGRVYSLYENTQFAYSPNKIKIISLIIINSTLLSCVLLFVLLDVTEYRFTWLGKEHRTCNSFWPIELGMVVGLSALFMFICTLYLFVTPMQKMIKLHRSTKIEKDFSVNFIAKVNKITSLTLIASISTFISAGIIGASDALWPTFIDMPLNCICLMFMTDYYPNGEHLLCCLLVKCRTRLFFRDNKNKLTSEMVYHVSQQSSVVDLKNPNTMSNDAVQQAQQETEEYLDPNNRQLKLALNNDSSYNPMVPMDDQRNSTNKYTLIGHASTVSDNLPIPSDTTIQNKPRSASRHKPANTMERMIMKDDPLGKQKTIMKQKTNTLDGLDMKLENVNDTMIHRSQSDEFGDDDDYGNNNNKGDEQKLLKFGGELGKINKNKNKNKNKTESYQLSDDQINDLMDTVDEVEPFKPMGTEEKEKSDGLEILEHTASNEFSTRL